MAFSFRERAAWVKARRPLSCTIGETVKLRRVGSSFMGLCPFHRERTPSFSVNDSHGRFRCFGCGTTGDAVDWIALTERKTHLQALQRLEAAAGIVTGGKLPLHAQRDGTAQANEQRTLERARRSSWARRLWQECQPLDGTVAELYLHSRSITIEPGPALAFHPSLKHPVGCRLPAMVAAVTDEVGRVSGVHRTFLKADGSGKAKVVPAKMMAGICSGGCVRLGIPGAAEGHTLAIAEGIETSLSVRQAAGLPVWAALSLSNMGGVPVPRDGTVRELILLADADETDREMADAMRSRAAERYWRIGLDVRIAHPKAGGDFNDMLRGET